MDTVCRDMSGRRLVLLIYTQRWIPGRPFELVGSLGGLTLAARLRSRGFDARSYTGITVDVVRAIREHISELFAVCFYCDFDNQNAIASISRSFGMRLFTSWWADRRRCTCRRRISPD